MAIDNIHIVPNNPNSLWIDDSAGEQCLENLILCVNDCKKHEIPMAVIHITDDIEPVPITDLGMDRIKKLVDVAEKQGVNLAFENLDHLENLDYIFQHIDSPRLGFCYDSGTEHYRYPDADCLSRYGKRLFAVHLYDNVGDGWTHLLPYDGTIGWKKLKTKLSNSRKVDYYTFEVNFNRKHEKSAPYTKLSADEYLALAYQRAQQFLSK